MEDSEQRYRTVHRLALRHGDKIGAIVALMVFGVFFWSAIALPLGRLSEPGPGFWPLLAASVGMAMAGLLFFFGRDVPVVAEDQSKRRLILNLLALVLYVPLYSLIGFIPASCVILVMLIRFAGQFSWLTTAICAIVGSVVVYAIFGIALSLPVDPF